MTRRLLIAATLLSAAGCGEPAEPPGSVVERGGAHARPTKILPAKVRPFSLARVDVVLLITGGTHGRLEVCNCPGPMAGGLSRRAGLALSYRAAHPNVVLLDCGDAFDARPADLRNRYIFRGYKAAGYDVVVLGANEWASLSSLLAPALRQSPMRYLATNASPVRRKLPLRREVVYRFGGKKLALLSVLGEGALWFTPVEIGRQLKLDGLEVVARRAAALKAAGCVVALVAHVTADEVDALRDVKGVDLIIRGHTTRSEPAPLRLGRTPLLKVGGREVVAAAALQIEAGRIAAMEYRVEVVNDHWPMDRYVMDVYQAYAHEAMRQALAAKRPKGLRYVSSVSCGRCHVAEYRAWRGGPHRKVWDRLVRAGRTDDPNCVMCHSSGFGAAGGFRTQADTPQLAGVNCQDCHRLDVEKGRCKMPAPKVSKDTCELCHTPVNSPRFDFEPYRRRVGCVRAHGGK